MAEERMVVTIFLITKTEGAISGWKKTPTQYHIQTDEGNERFFRFQTYTGQYRKERRLDDGTVIGSYGWVDPSGYLRMTDYIADSKGYRVVKELMEYVGTNSIAEEPVQAQQRNKYSSSSSNKHSTKVSFPVGHNYVFKKPPPPTQNTEEIVYEVPAAAAVTTPKSPPPVIVVYGPSNPNKEDERGAGGYDSVTKSKLPYNGSSRFGRNRPAVQQLRNSEAEESVQGSSEKDVFKKYTTPLRRNNKSSGFIYKIPHQYHKEEWNNKEGSRQGSFGYVDPFGIRRVIHYNANNNGGFQATKDFKYVGEQY